MDDLMGFSGGETKYMVNPRLGEPPVPAQRNSTFQGCCLGRFAPLVLVLHPGFAPLGPRPPARARAMLRVPVCLLPQKLYAHPAHPPAPARKMYYVRLQRRCFLPRPPDCAQSTRPCRR